MDVAIALRAVTRIRPHDRPPSGGVINTPVTDDNATPENGWDRRRRRVARHIEGVALELFADLGYANVTMTMIAEAAGVGLRTVARYFPQKEDLLLAVPRETQRQTLIAVPNLAGDPDPLTGLIEQYQRLARENSDAIPRFSAWIRAVSTSPELWSRAIGDNTTVLEHHLAEYVAQALGVDPEEDVRPLALSAAVLAAVDAMNRFKASREELKDVPALLGVIIESLRTDFARLHDQRDTSAKPANRCQHANHRRGRAET